MPESRWIAGIVLAAVAVAAWIGPVYQDPAYHLFADSRACGPVPNCLDVLSNLAFLAVAAVGLALLQRWPAGLHPALAVFWVGVLLVASGSAWYHWAPDDARLVWDRLPMTVAFMGLFAAVLIDRLQARVWVLPALVAVGLASVAVWRLTGDLRLYGLVQFLPPVAIVALLVRRPGGAIPASALMWALGWYAAAKAAEAFDRQILELTGLIGGHALKHLLAALATAGLWRPDTAGGRDRFRRGGGGPERAAGRG